MIELFAGYTQVGPLATGLLLFPLGLSVGSFSTVLCHRLAHKQSIVWPRSHCPACQHLLSAFDMVPLVSFVFLRRRCRYCSAAIPWRYPALELGSGLLSASWGFAAGWAAGFAALVLWMAGAVMLSRTWSRGSQAGITMVETLVAVALLVAVLMPMLNFRSVVTGNVIFQRQIAITLASGMIEKFMDTTYRSPKGVWEPLNKWDRKTVKVGQYEFTEAWIFVEYDPPNDWLRRLVVEVTCDCSHPAAPVRLTTVLAKVPQNPNP